MAGNSYTFAVIVIIGLIALFLIYWYTTSNTSRKMQHSIPQMMRRETFADGDDEDYDEDGQEDFANNEDDEDGQENNENGDYNEGDVQGDFSNMKEVVQTNAGGSQMTGKVNTPSKEQLYRMSHAQNFPPETRKPKNSDLVGQNLQTEYSQNPALQQLRQAACFPKEMLTPEELKPQDNSSLWAQVNPQGEGSLKGRSFLQAGHHIGINTVGQTLRNANLQLRSEPPNPQVLVSPWNQTTIEPDVNRRPLEIGGCA